MNSKKAEEILEREINIAEAMLNQENIGCKFCGQVLIVGQECNCSDAVEEKRKKTKIKKAIEMTLPMLTEEEICCNFDFEPINSVPLLNFLCSAIELAGNEFVEKIAIKVDNNTTLIIQDRVDFVEISRKENTSKAVKLGG